jgi:uncharacterized protein YggU (UPF0235/DUF167 family)
VCVGLRVYTMGSRLCVGVRVSPSAPQTQLRGVHGDRLKVAVAAAPEDDRANRVLEDALAGWLGVRRDQVRVTKGYASRDKVVAFTELTEERLRQLVAVALAKCRVTGDGSLA